jgi:hypothetical protein
VTGNRLVAVLLTALTVIGWIGFAVLVVLYLLTFLPPP